MAIDFNKYFRYEEGVLIRTKAPTKRPDLLEKPVGCADAQGYLVVTVEGRSYKVHRVVWEMKVGAIPKGYMIDHINNNKRDNRVENLRLATKNQNECNKAARSDSSSGVKNVVWNGQRGGWSISISYEGKRRRFGLFDTVEKAADKVFAFRKEMHGEFAHKCIGG